MKFYYIMSNFKKTNTTLFSLVLAIVLLFAGISVFSQTRIISPYSMYGIGELNHQRLSRNLGMAGIGYGYRSNLSVNYLNPASYSAIDSTSFIFEAVGFSHFYQQETVTQNQSSNYSSLGNLVFGFPVNKRISVGAGLKPYSLVGYKILDSEAMQTDGHINYLYEGAGGINQVFIGTSFKLLDELSLGVNASYLFGTIEDRTTVFSDDIPGFFRSYKKETDNISGFIFDAGLQYHKKLSETRNFTLGVTYSHDYDLDIERSKLIQRELTGSTSLDTLDYSKEEKGLLHITKSIGVGSWLKYNENWSGGFDVAWQNWENFQRFGSGDELQDSYNVALGVKYSPTVATYSGIFSHAKYMAGVRYGQSYLNVNDYNFDEFGISFGIYLPIRRTRNGISLGFEYAQRGTTDHNLIKEDFYRVNIGVNIYERWFIRRKFF